MKKVIDIEKAMLAMFIINKAFKSKFKRYWGVTTVDGVEVFNKELTYYNMYNRGLTASKPVQDALKILGIAKSINESVGDYQGVERAWFFINPDKATTAITEDLTLSLLASRIEAAYTAYTWYNAVITINASNILDGVMPIGQDGKRHFDPESAETWLLTNYGTLVGSSVQSSTELRPDDAEFSNDILAKYVLLDRDAEVFDVEITGVSMTGTPTAGGLIGSVTIEMRFKRNTLLVDEDAVYLVALKPILEQKAAIRDMNFIISSRSIGLLSSIGDDAGATNDLFYNGYLLTSTLQLERSEFSKLIKVCIDADYKKYVKKRKWYQKLLAIIVFVVIIWVSWGWAAPAGAAISATTIAYAATAAALLLSLASMAFSALGYADLVGFYGKFVKIFGMVGTVLGITAALQNMAQRGIMETIKAKISEIGTGLMKFSSEMMFKSLSYVGQLTNMVIGNQLKKINNANNSLQDKINDQEEELYDMYDKEFNLPLEALTWQNSPLKVDDAQFEVDYLYEPTKMNICRRSFF